MAKEHQARYLRFKADEASQAITGPYRQLNPEDNNERQSIHEHVSVALPLLGTTKVAHAARITTKHVGTAALGRPAGRSPAVAASTATFGASK
jgi:hypothetical protein